MMSVHHEKLAKTGNV